jgi:hypothetical protein
VAGRRDERCGRCRRCWPPRRVRADEVEPLPALERPSAERRAGLPEVGGRWLFAGWETPPPDSAAEANRVYRLTPPGEIRFLTQRLDSVAGQYGVPGQYVFPFVGEVRRDGVFALVASGGETGQSFLSGRVVRDTLWMELTNVGSVATWPPQTARPRAAPARGALPAPAGRRPHRRAAGLGHAGQHPPRLRPARTRCAAPGPPGWCREPFPCSRAPYLRRPSRRSQASSAPPSSGPAAPGGGTAAAAAATDAAAPAATAPPSAPAGAAAGPPRRPVPTEPPPTRPRRRRRSSRSRPRR